MSRRLLGVLSLGVLAMVAPAAAQAYTVTVGTGPTQGVVSSTNSDFVTTFTATRDGANVNLSDLESALVGTTAEVSTGTTQDVDNSITLTAPITPQFVGGLDLETGGTGQIIFDGASAISVGDGDVTLDGSSVLDSGLSITGGTVTLGAVNSGSQGPASLSISSTQTIYEASIGSSSALASLTSDASYSYFHHASITTDGAQTYDDGTDTLEGDLTLNACRVDIAGAVGDGYGGPYNLSLNADGPNTLAQSVAVGSLADTGATTIDTGVGTSAAQDYWGPVTVPSGDTAEFTADEPAAQVTFHSTLDGPGAITLDGSGSESLGAVGSVTPIASLTDTLGDPQTNTTGHTSLNAEVDSAGAQSYTGPVGLGANVTLSSTGASKLTGAISGPGGLTVAGPGSVALSGNNTFSGALDVNRGLLSISGNDGQAISVDAGATLSCAGGTLTGAISNHGGSLTGGPAAPTEVVAAPGDGQVSVSFSPGAPNCYPVSYTAAATPGGAEVTGTSSPLTLSGLTDGTEYSFTVTATNPVGTATSSASSQVSPVPSATQSPASASQAVSSTGSVSGTDAGSSASGSTPITPTTTVPDPPRPMVTLIVAGSRHVFAEGQRVRTRFSCHAVSGGPALRSCTDSNGARRGTGQLKTSRPGRFSYWVTAVAKDGQRTTKRIVYTVRAKPNAARRTTRRRV